MTLPMIGGMLSMVVFHLTDLYFVSWLDRGLAEAQYKAAMTFTFPIVQFIFMISLGIGIATASVTSRAIGNGDHHRVQRLTVDALALTFLMIGLVAILTLVFMEPLFAMLNAQERLGPLIRGYMSIWLVGIPIVVLPMIGNNAIRAAGDTLWPAMIMAFAAVVNCLLDPLLIFGVDWLGIPRLEMQGAALATVLSRLITLAASLAILHRKRMLTFERPRWAEVWISWRALLWIGLPASLTSILWPITQGVITRIIAGYGENSVAAYGAGSRIEGLAMMVLWSLATVLMVFTGQNWAAGRCARVYRAQRLSRRFALIWGITCWGVFILFGRAIASIYAHDNPEVLIKTQMYLLIAPAGYGLRGVTFLTARSFSALNKPVDATVVDCFRMFVLYIPMAYFGSYLGDVAGVFIAIAVSNIAAGLVAVGYFGRVQRRIETAGESVAPVAEAAMTE
jgi:putative MATE family efflux protein